MDRVQQTIATYNKIAVQYAQNLLKKGQKKELGKFAQLLKPHSKVLDIGCAAGRDTQALHDKGFEVVGIDLSEELLKIAKEQHSNISFIMADMRKMPFADNSFDGIFATAVLHHLEKNDMVGALQEVRRVLVQDGIVYIETKMGEGKLTTNEIIASDEERQFTLLTLNELDKMLRESGFQKIDLYSEESRSRKGLFWINAFYRKV